jgi:hypothetical protein
VNSVEQNVKNAIEKREQDIIHHYVLADAHKDDKEIKLATQEMEEFSKANPGVPIRKDLIQFIRSQARAQHGVSLPKGLRDEIKEKYEPGGALAPRG